MKFHCHDLTRQPFRLYLLQLAARDPLTSASAMHGTCRQLHDPTSSEQRSSVTDRLHFLRDAEREAA